ncbi:MAG TPA: hypothetical protein VLT36_00520 [Candidatus Dormibacteraeota bacterium]|nr:hypothetical protein [Candidatus Dormibacteraeota bacterium]
MKLLFFSPDTTEVLNLGKEFVDAGIPCEVRNTAKINGSDCEAELWIRNDKDSHRALMLCVQLGVGFAKRPRKTSLIECWSDLSSRPEEEEEDYENGDHSNGHDRGDFDPHPHANGARHHRMAVMAKHRH